METLLRDLRLGWRHLLKNRAFAATALLTLALGIGAAAAMFSVVDAVLLRQLPYRDPDRLVVLTGTFAEHGEVTDWPISQADFADWRRASRAFTDMSVVNLDGDLALNLEGVQEPERLSGEVVSAGYFPLLGVGAARGRWFLPAEDARPYGDFVVVVSHDLWRRRFGGDPGLLGRSLQLNGKRYRVIGIAPEGFRGLSDKADLWIPSQLPPVPFYLTDRRVRWLAALARLAPGVSLAQAQQDMNGVTATLARQYPEDQGMGVRVTGLRDHWFGDLRRGLLILSLGACVLLAIACINVANLLLARAVAEQRSYAISMALGAARGRLVRQLLTESLLLALLGAALGLLLAQWATPALLALSGFHFQSWLEVSAGRLEVIAAIVALAALCGVAFGLVPVWITFQSGITQALSREGKQPPRGSARRRFQSAVVVAQVALALLLAASAGLMAKGFRQLTRQELGFRPDHLLSYRIDLRGPSYREDDRVRRLVRQYLEELPAVAGVAQVALADPTLPSDGWSGSYISVEGRPSEAPDGSYPAMMDAVSADYFQMLGIPLRAGRSFGPRELEPSGVVVSQAAADKYWPGQSPLGKRLRRGGAADQGFPWLSVLGVVADVKNEGLLEEQKRPAPDIYFPVTQFPLRLPLTVNFLVRARHGVAAASLMPALRRQMRAVAPDLGVYDVASLQERLDRQTQKARFQVLLIGLFSLLALVLATVGIYGVVAYSVAQGTREIAIRMSMGANRADILRMVVGRGAALAGIGLALGLAALLLLGRQLGTVLFRTSAGDPFILGGACVVLLAVALAANYLPARRAAKLEPAIGLRPE
jgi:putative ABC transport system permease protein